MNHIPSKTLHISPSISYKYYYSKAKSSNSPTFLFLHGFPSSAADFRPQLEYLNSRGYGVIAPDLLGYGGTSKPADHREYVWRSMSNHIAAILDAEGLEKVVGVGHDLGSWFLSRLCHFHQSRFSGLVFLDVGYAAPGTMFDVEAINRLTKGATGEEMFRYWDFFTDDEGVAIMDRQVASVLSLLHSSPEVMAANMGPRGRTREWVSAGRVAETHSFGGGDAWGYEYFREKVAMFQEGGWTGPTNWYKALGENLSFEDERDMRREIEMPVMVVGCGRDEMTNAGLQGQMTRPWAKSGYRFEVLDTGHWVMLEDAEGTNRLLEKFVSTIARR